MDQYKPTKSGKISFREWETAYQIFGDLPEPTPTGALPKGRVPLVVLHGGPGIPGRYLLPVTTLWESHGIPVVLYDQIGCGDSTHLREKGGDFWTMELFLAELDNVLQKLGITQYDLLGHSWGAMLAAEHALRHPPGLHKLIISDGLASVPQWADNANELVKQLPQEDQDAIAKYEKTKEYDNPAYKKATEVFLSKFVCRMDPWPQEMLGAFTLMEEDPTVYSVMLGASEFSITGTLKTWDITSQVSKISAPTLVLNGKYDEASDPIVAPFVEKIDGAKWVKFEESSHMPMLEEREKYAKVVGDWLLYCSLPEGARGA